MSRLYMMRHGQTLFNVLRRKQGWCDSPLTELGMEQARTTGAWFSERGIEFDHVYSSTSERACDTTELVVPGAAYERVKGLKEWNFGRLEGLTEDVDPPTPYNDFFVTYGGEGMMAFRRRLVDTLTEIMRRPGHESVLAVSHGAACAQFLRAWDPDALTYGTGLGNCCVVIYDFDGDATFTFDRIENPNA